jgi:hypothetical protein
VYNVQVSEPLEGSQMRRIYSAYPGTGSVYTVIAKHGTSATAYVPSITYACSIVYWTDTCVVLSEFLHFVCSEIHCEFSRTAVSLGFDSLRVVLVSDTTFSRVLCALIFFVGLFVSLYGHHFFKTEMFLLGFLSGGLISYILIAVFSTLSSSGMICIFNYLFAVFKVYEFHIDLKRNCNSSWSELQISRLNKVESICCHSCFILHTVSLLCKKAVLRSFDSVGEYMLDLCVACIDKYSLLEHLSRFVWERT